MHLARMLMVTGGMVDRFGHRQVLVLNGGVMDLFACCLMVGWRLHRAWQHGNSRHGLEGQCQQ